MNPELELRIRGDAPMLAKVLAALTETAATVSVATHGSVAVGPVVGNTISAATQEGDEGDEGPASTAATDSTGLPWDERIHASSRSQTKEGKWRQRKGVAPGVVTAIEAELRTKANQQPPQQPVAQFAQPVVPHAQFAPPQQPVAQFAPPQQPVAQFAPPQQPVAQFAPPQQPVAQFAPPQQPVAQGSGDNVDFNRFMQIVTASMAQPGLMSHEYITQVTNELAAMSQTPLSSLTDLVSHQNLIPYMLGLLRRDGKIA